MKLKKTNFVPFLSNGKHHASSLNSILLYNIYIVLMIVHLSIGNEWNPSCTKNPLTNPPYLPLWNKIKDSMLCLAV
jgi:hypothetical protein